MSRCATKRQNSFAVQSGKKMKRNLFLVCVLSLIGFPSFSQDTIRLNLQDVIAASISNNDAVKLSALDAQIAGAKFRQTEAFFLPRLNVSYSAMTTNNPLYAFGFKLQQQSVAAADFDPKSLNNPSATPDFSAAIELQQSILNPGLIYQRKGAGKQEEMAQYALNRTREFITLQAEKACLQLQMAFEENKVLKETLLTSKAVYKTARDYYDQGLIQKSDLLNAGVHVMNIETQIENSKSNIQDVADMISMLMGRSAGTMYSIDPVGISGAVNTDSADLSGERSDFKMLEKGMESIDMMIKSSKMNYLPELKAFGSWQWNDRTMFGFNANAYLAGVQLSWNIFNGNRTRNTISEQQMEKEKLSRQLDQQKREARLEINATRRQLSDATFTMKQQKLAIEQASEALRVLQNRYAQGLAKTTDVLMAQTQWSQQRIGYIHAEFSYHLALVSMQFLIEGK
jgi:outer membrane protein TolC